MSQLNKIIEELELVPCLLYRQYNGKALRTESVYGFSVPIDRLTNGSPLIVYATALDPATAAADGFRLICTSPIVKFTTSDSTVTIQTNYSTYMAIYKFH